MTHYKFACVGEEVLICGIGRGAVALAGHDMHT